jgi:hypothetical protein
MNSYVWGSPALATLTMTWDAPAASPTASVSVGSSASASPTPVGVALPGGGASVSPAASGGGGGGCAPDGGGFKWLPYHSLDGRVLGVDAAAGDAAGCRRACCATPGCDGFTLQVLPAPVRGTCALLANLTQLVPAVTFGAGLLRGALPADVAL